MGSVDHIKIPISKVSQHAGYLRKTARSGMLVSFSEAPYGMKAVERPSSNITAVVAGATVKSTYDPTGYKNILLDDTKRDEESRLKICKMTSRNPVYLMPQFRNMTKFVRIEQNN